MELKLETCRRFTINFLYVGCLIGGITFSWNTIKQYLLCNTSFLTTTESLLLQELPVLVICYQRGASPKIRGVVSPELSSTWELNITDVLVGALYMVRIKTCWKVEIGTREELLDSQE